jgi:hypothetical protein
MKKTILFMILVLPFLLSCKKLVEVATPQNQLTTDKVFSDTTAATAAMVNVYALFDKSIDPNYNKYMGVYTDELTSSSASSDNVQFSTGKLSATNGTVGNIWSVNYFAIYSCNQILEALQPNPAIPASTARTLTGEAKFLRAYAYFYLVNSYGAVPLVLTTAVNQTARAVRTDTATVYQQIVSDLLAAQTALPQTYTGTGKVRANRYAATALLARVYLYERDWADAETQASAVINSGVYSLPSPAAVFLAGSSETILAFWTQNGFITDAPNLVPSSGAPVYPVSAGLLAAFEPGDGRKASWLKAVTVGTTTYAYPYKYHNRTNNTAMPEYLMALRLGEQYLVRAEARAQQGNIPGAVQDLNTLRTRAGLPGLSASLSLAACFNAIAQEWRVEMFTEWGSRYLTLKRTGRINPVMAAYKSAWLPSADLLPLPQNDLNNDPFLTQNAGY